MSKILLLGDICLTGYSISDPHLTDRIQNSIVHIDHIFANLEFSFHDKLIPDNINYNKVSLFAPSSVSTLLSSITGVCLANNHSMDLGYDTAKYTKELLETHNIKSWGIGANLNDARAPQIIKIDNYALAILSYSCLTTNGENYATFSCPGVPPLSVEYVIEDIAAAKQLKSDFIMVSLHWGVENSHMPTPDQVAIAHKIIDEGADLIWGHHPHTIQPVELYKNKIIAYSLGNFAFRDIEYITISGNSKTTSCLKQSLRNKESIGLEIELYNNEIHLINIIPFSSKNDGIPEKIKLSDLSFDFNDHCKQLDRFIRRYHRKIKQFNNPQMQIVFNGRIYQIKNTLLPFHRWAKQSFFRKYLTSLIKSP